MLITPMAPPQAVPIASYFDYMTVDSARRRVYAAHTGNRALLIVNADTAAIIGQVRVGPLHGVAIDPDSGFVYTGDGEARTVSEVDPSAMKVVASADVPGPVDAIAYDPALHRIYADEDDGGRVFVIDSRSMKQTGTIVVPGHHPEYLAIDPKSHRLYQNIANLNEFVIVDPATLKVLKTVKTPEIDENHPLQIDAGLGHLYDAGRNGVLSTYDLDGKLLGQTKFHGSFDQCDVDAREHLLACAGDGGVTVFSDGGAAGVSVLGIQAIDRGVHTVGVDDQSRSFWAVWGSQAGDFIQHFRIAP
ncbi:MAG: YncE family protein [Candidatus Eremiobacteraeota bacterium]|nr:YncE family protein [Candidatus Eremiobacteraeota bacterium]